MKKHDYVIVGGGMAAAAAVEGIREVDATGSIAMLSQESDAPYNRPPLTKALWKGKPIESIWRRMDNVELQTGRIVTRIDTAEKLVECDDGSQHSYGKLLLATGGKVRRLPFQDDSIIYYRTLSDYRRLRELTETGRKFAVIGGGFIGSEIAAALAMNGKEVVMIFPGDSICQRVFPSGLSQYVSESFQQKGVELLSGERVINLESQETGRLLTTASGREILVDGVIAGIGVEPNVALAQSAGLKVDDGIVVDEFLHTSIPDIYAAGDVASFPIMGGHRRVEHEDNANSMGKQAGRNMAGNKQAYTHLPMFYSDLFEMGYEAVGTLDSRLETYVDWKRPNEEGVVYYLKEGRVRGVLLWNVWGKIDAARELIRRPESISVASLQGHLL